MEGTGMERIEREIMLAFNRLIERAGIEKITTQMIAREAGIGRATFYRYFKDKYDVLNRNYKELLDAYLAKCGNYRELFFYLYTYARDKWSNFHRAFSTTGVNSFENYIFSYSKSVVIEITAQNRGGKGLTQEEDMQLDVLCYGISYMYKKWTLGRYELDPAAAADALYSIMPESLKHYWLVKQAHTESGVFGSESAKAER